jgi:preprotein translocase subunit YajC
MFFESIAYAQGTGAPAAAGGLDNYMNFLPIVLIVVVFYFFILRPQSKKAKEQKNFLDTLKRGDKVVTSSGMLGTIAAIDDAKGVVTVEVAKDTQIKLLKSYVSAYQKVEEAQK